MKNLAKYISFGLLAAMFAAATLQDFTISAITPYHKLVEQRKAEELKFKEIYCKANEGNVASMVELGLCYSDGKGVPRDYKKAVKWYRKAAELGDSDAMYNLGDCYFEGHGVAQDFTKAVEWYRKAAELGNTSAKERLEELGY